MTSPDVEFTVRSYFSLMDRGQLAFLGRFTASSMAGSSSSGAKTTTPAC